MTGPPAGTAQRAAGLAAASLAAIRRHWVLAALLAAGLVLRVLAQLAYQPALLYIDSTKYLYNAYPGADPVGYKVPLKAILAVGGLPAVTAAQHLLGLAMAVAIYVILLRRGVPRWLAALATAPVLLDAYQIQIEQTIMPDVWFEALLVAAIAVLLLPAVTRPGWRGLAAVTAGGLLLGASATVRQVGEIGVLPALVYLLVAGGGWRTVLTRAAGLVVGFAIPVGGYMTGSYLITGHFWLASSTPSLASYGRMATAADCATLRIPDYERKLCPTARQKAFGIDWLDHDVASPLKTYTAPAGMNKYAVIASFDHQVAEQQPLRVLAAIAADGAKLFALTRTSAQTGTPISRWQFQQNYPAYGNWVMLGRHHEIVLGLRLTAGSPVITRHVLDRSYGGPATVSRPLARFLRGYQLHGGYAPGPLMALFALAGLAGSLLALGRRPARSSPRANTRDLGRACLLFFAVALAVLALSDAFQFSWRYQLPALITVPPAGVAGLALAGTYLRARGRDDGGTAGQQDAAELAQPRGATGDASPVS